MLGWCLHAHTLRVLISGPDSFQGFQSLGTELPSGWPSVKFRSPKQTGGCSSSRLAPTLPVTPPHMRACTPFTLCIPFPTGSLC